MAYTQQPTPDPTTAGPEVHVTGRRVVANLIDGVVLSVVSWPILLLFGWEPATASTGSSTGLPSGAGLVVLVVTALYYVLMEGLLGRTVGKYATGIRVVDAATGAVPGVGKAALRTLLRLVDGIFAYLVGFITVLASQRRQRLGDMAAKTLVVRA